MTFTFCMITKTEYFSAINPNKTFILDVYKTCLLLIKHHKFFFTRWTSNKKFTLTPLLGVRRDGEFVIEPKSRKGNTYISLLVVWASGFKLESIEDLYRMIVKLKSKTANTCLSKHTVYTNRKNLANSLQTRKKSVEF